MFDAREFHDLATDVADAHPSEAGYRVGINRCYYACFLVGCDAVCAKGWPDPGYTGDSHSALRRTLKEHAPALAAKLTDLYRLREHADYHTGSLHRQLPGDCKLCKDQNGWGTVSRDAWERTRAITADILPRLWSITPTDKRQPFLAARPTSLKYE